MKKFILQLNKSFLLAYLSKDKFPAKNRKTMEGMPCLKSRGISSIMTKSSAKTTKSKFALLIFSLIRFIKIIAGKVAPSHGAQIH